MPSQNVPPSSYLSGASKSVLMLTMPGATRLTGCDAAGGTGGLVSVGETRPGAGQEGGAGLQEVVGRDRARPHQASGG